MIGTGMVVAACGDLWWRSKVVKKKWKLLKEELSRSEGVALSEANIISRHVFYEWL